MLAVTAGFHRLWTHQSYETTNFIKILLLLLCNSSFQNPVNNWTANHRMHHRYEEINPSLDPYSIKKGFLWAHIISFTNKKSPEYLKEYDKVRLELRECRSTDKFGNKLIDNYLLDFEENYYYPLVILTGFIIPTHTCYLIYNDNYFSCLISVIITIILTWHSTWSVNSLAHLVGTKPYLTEHTSVNNYFVSLITSGEGYHNYHHAYPKDYKASLNLRCYNPTGWFIYILHKFNLAYNLSESENIIIKKLPCLHKVTYKIKK